MGVQFSLIDGVPADCLDVADRGSQYGDGVFRTLRVAAGRPLWWDEQLAKLAEDCAGLGMACPPAAIWQADIERLHLGEGALKLTVTRGSGPRGYRPPEPACPRRIVQFQSMSRPSLPEAGMTARVCDLRLGWQPRLAGIKHLNRLENCLARAEWNDADIHEGLLLDQAGNAIGGTMSNLFIVYQGRLLTPDLTRCGVAGVTRVRLLHRARAEGLAVEICDFDLNRVLAADEVMFTNSLIGLWHVRRLDEREWGRPVISQRLAEWLND